MESEASFEHSVFDAETIRSLDQTTIEEIGIPGFTLMEIAGREMALNMMTRLEPQSTILVVAGKGNNGGDALVVARYLIREGHDVFLYLMASSEEFSDDAKSNFNILNAIAPHSPGILEILNPKGKPNLDALPRFADHVVDGLLGTGLSSDLRGHYTEVVEWINHALIPVHAVDIPTGLHPDTGNMLGNAIIADYTYTFGGNKIGFYLNHGPDLTGQLEVIPLPFPPSGLNRPEAVLLTGDETPDISHELSTHKYETGVVWIIAGSHGLTGAARLAAQSAWSQGAGAVFLAVPSGLTKAFDDLEQIIKIPIGEHDQLHFEPWHIEQLMQQIERRPGTLLVGPGLGRKRSVVSFVQNLLAKLESQIVIDADALWALSQNWVSKPESASWILTPHPGELKLLSEAIPQISPAQLDDDRQRLNYLTQVVSSHQISFVSKGKPTIAAMTNNTPHITTYETRLFARAGFGDVLSGAIAALWSRIPDELAATTQAMILGWKRAHKIHLSGTTPEPKDLCQRQ